MRMVVLGAGTLRPDPLRGAPGFWLEGESALLLVDCGSGTARAMAGMGLPWEDLTHVLITHFHTDHVAELAPLLFALKHGTEPRRTQPLTLVGPRGLRAHLAFLAGAHGPYVEDPGFPLEVVELEGGESWVPSSGAFTLRTHPTKHVEGSLAYRLEMDGMSVGFTGDTGVQEGLSVFFSGVGLLVSECSHPDGEGMETHLTPSQVASLASGAQPGLLVTVHAYPPLDPESVPDLLGRAGYTGRVVAGRDGMWIHLLPGGAEVGSTPA